MSNPVPVPADCEPLIAALRRLVRSLDRGSRRLMQERGLTAPQITLMRLLAARPGASVGELARTAGMGQATVTDILDRLVARGNVARARSTVDRRVAELRLTPAGESLLTSLPLPLPAKFVERFDALPADRRQQLIEAISWMAVNLDPDSVQEIPNPTE